MTVKPGPSPKPTLLGSGARILAGGALTAAFAASACCILPVALFSLGLSGAWISTFTQVAPYKPILIAATLGFAGSGYWLVFRASKRACAEDKGAHHSNRNRWLSLFAQEPGTNTERSVVTCPHCGTAKAESMPIDACQFFYDCTGCGARLKPKPGDCCVFCSYGSIPCPPVQEHRAQRAAACTCG